MRSERQKQIQKYLRQYLDFLFKSNNTLSLVKYEYSNFQTSNHDRGSQEANEKLQFLVSACTSVNSEWENVGTETPLPVESGTVVTFNCPKKYTNVGGSTGKCLDGQLQPVTEPPRCYKTSMDML